jgi:hypothetical protein
LLETSNVATAIARCPKAIAIDLRRRGAYWTLEKVGETLGVHASTVMRWVPVSEIADAISETPAVTNTRGQQRPASYKPRAKKSAVATAQQNVLAFPGGDRSSHTGQGSDTTLPLDAERGAAYLLARVRRDAPKVFERVQRGEDDGRALYGQSLLSAKYGISHAWRFHHLRSAPVFGAAM